MIEVIALTGALTDPGKHRVTAIGLGDVIDQFHHVHGLADPGTTEQTDLAALGERADQVNYLDPGRQQLNRGGQFIKLGRIGVDRTQFIARNRTGFVDRTTQHIHDPTERACTDRHRNRCTGVGHLHAATQTVGGP